MNSNGGKDGNALYGESSQAEIPQAENRETAGGNTEVGRTEQEEASGSVTEEASSSYHHNAE
jgi:hypothetical protein